MTTTTSGAESDDATAVSGNDGKRTLLSRITKPGVRTALMALFLLYAGLGALAVIDDTLALMHQPGHASVSASAILSPSSIAQSNASTNATAISEWWGWNTYFNDHFGQRVVSPYGLVFMYLGVDIIFIAFPVVLLLLGAVRYSEIHLAPAFEDWRAGLAQPLRFASYATAAYLAFDIIEDVVLLGITVLLNPGLATGPNTFGVLHWLIQHVGWAIPAVGVVSAAKLLFLFSAALGCAAGLAGTLGPPVASKEDSKEKVSRRRAVVALRAHLGLALILIALLALGSDLGRQLDDAFLLLFEPHHAYLIIATAIVAIVTTGTLLATARMVLHAYQSEPSVPGPAETKKANKIILSLGFGAMVVGGAAIALHWPAGQVAFVPGAIALLLGLFGFKRDAAVDKRPDEIRMNTQWGARVAGALSVAPFAVLFALSMRNGARLFAVKDGTGWWLLLCMVLCILVVAAVVHWSPKLCDHATDRNLDPSLWRRLALAVASLIAFGGLGYSPQITGSVLGPWGVLFALVFALTLGFAALVLLSDAYYPGNVLAASGLRRLPVIAIVLISAVATSLTDGQSTYHSVRLKDGAAGSRVTVDEALDQWSRSQTEVTPNRPAKRQPIPLVFVASAGGGIRAAYWTTIVLNCLVKGQDSSGRKPIGMDVDNVCAQPMPMDSIFLASGISGGSLGLAVTKAFKDVSHNPWSEPLGNDFLGPTVAGVAFRDLPNAFVRVRVDGQDSAAVLERSWEKSVREANGDLESGFLATAWSSPGRLDFPLLALNGTSVTDGCRVTVSVLKLADAGTSSNNCLSIDRVVTPIEGVHAQLQTLAATKDAFDSTCPADVKQPADPKDLSLSTAALLSARFPYVSPNGTLYWCKDRAVRTFDLDGGLIDASAAAPLALAWPEVVKWLARVEKKDGKCFSPKLILIDNGYVTSTKSEVPNRPPGLIAPLTAFGAVGNARSAAARQAAALDFEKFFPPGRCGGSTVTGAAPPAWELPDVVDFYPVAQPGVEAPLGWTLSERSKKSLGHQLGNKYNRCSAAIVAQWFTGATGQPPDGCKKK
jgi:hypothetical protein